MVNGTLSIPLDAQRRLRVESDATDITRREITRSASLFVSTRVKGRIVTDNDDDSGLLSGLAGNVDLDDLATRTTDAPAHRGEWQLPEHDVAIFSPYRNRNALVIPVINEGSRLSAQLRRLAALALPVDVVVADGGSTDGSVEPNALKSNHVRALLIKRGPGRLSAQLRMAYAWCLQEGYDGIITVDGNGKDDLSAIRDFVAALEAGYDYIQGSRYLEGGYERNTPLDRKLAGRLVHAPLLSLAARHWYTDTTNGFRAYSRRYLIDPRLLPFRDTFQNYALLFYLTVQASRLGFRSCEIPVSRIYPARCRTPTKIVGLLPRWRLFLEMFDVVRGRFEPPAEARRRPWGQAWKQVISWCRHGSGSLAS